MFNSSITTTVFLIQKNGKAVRKIPDTSGLVTTTS